MLHISRKWKCYFRLSADMTLRAGAGLLFTESLKLEKTFKMEPNHFGLLYPTKLSITKEMDINRDSHLDQLRVLQTW